MAEGAPEGMRIRNCRQEDFFRFMEMDWGSQPKERDTIYLILCVDHALTSFIAEETAGRWMGVLLASRSDDGSSCFLNHLRVLSPFRGRGVGTALVERLKERCASLGVRRIWFFTEERNRRFYERLGFREDQGILAPRVAAYAGAHKGLTMSVDPRLPRPRRPGPR